MSRHSFYRNANVLRFFCCSSRLFLPPPVMCSVQHIDGVRCFCWQLNVRANSEGTYYGAGNYSISFYAHSNAYRAIVYVWRAFCAVKCCSIYVLAVVSVHTFCLCLLFLLFADDEVVESKYEFGCEGGSGWRLHSSDSMLMSPLNSFQWWGDNIVQNVDMMHRKRIRSGR